MSVEIFLRNFKNYSELELKQVIDDKKIYVEEARKAAHQILEERTVGVKNYSENNSENKLQNESSLPIEETAINSNSNKSLLTDDLNAPQLHSKKVIRVFSILFSTLFGSVLLMTNMKEVKNTKAKFQVLIFGIIYSFLSILVITYFETRNLTMPFNFIGSWILSEYFWNKYIGKETLYRKRSWHKALIISIIVTIPLILAMIYNQ
jgi:hypothetical protein